MGIAKMNKVYLLAHQAEKDTVLAVLQQAGVMEITDLSTPSAENEDWVELVESDEEQEALSVLDAKHAEVRFSLDFLNRYYPQKKSLLESLSGSKTVIEAKKINHSAEEWAQVSERVYKALKKIDEKLMSIRNEETRLQNLKVQLTPWQKLTLPLEEVKRTSAVHVELGVTPTDEQQQLNNDLKDLAVYLQTVSEHGNESNMLIAYHAADTDVVEDVLKRHGFSKQAFPHLTGTVQELLSKTEQDFVRLQEERQAALEETQMQDKYRETLSYYLDYLVTERDKKQVVTNFARTENSFLLEGWIRMDDEPKIRELLQKKCETVEVFSREPLPGEMFPVALENKKVFAPFEFITKLYDHPSPQGLDPTPTMAPFFVVFFGLCMTDAGYGIVLALLGALGLWKIKAGAARRLMWILVAGGISTIVFGWLVGGWFGTEVLGAPFLFNAMEDPMQMLIYALGIGVIQIFFGMGIQFWRLSKEGKVLDAIFDVGLWYLLFIGFGMFAFEQTAGIASTVTLAAVIGLILTQGRKQPGIIKKFLSGLLSLYNITGYLSDVLSYSRLMALGLATGVIALAINTMAGLLTGNPLLYVFMVILLIAGHTFNVVINALGSYIHSSRLQYIEFYNRFYEGGGRAFVPFTLKTKNIEIQPDWQQK